MTEPELKELNMPIKAISFDFWNTLYVDDKILQRHECRVEFLIDLLNKNGFNKSRSDIADSLKYASEKFDFIWEKEHRTLKAEEGLKFALSELGVILPPEDFGIASKFFEEIILEFPPSLIEGVKEAIPILSKKYLLGITSDTGYSPGRILRKILENDGLLKYFRALTFSDETGFSKPNIKAFLNTINILGVKPEETIHIGDIDRTDIIGAKSIGMKTVLYIGKNGRDKETTSADYVIRSWNEFLEFLRELSNSPI
jgi:putative hydrolase of the HAD superfamily